MKEYIKVGLNEPRKIMAFSLSQTRKRDKNRMIKKRTTKTKRERKKNKRKKEKQKKEKKGKRERSIPWKVGKISFEPDFIIRV